MLFCKRPQKRRINMLVLVVAMILLQSTVRSAATGDKLLLVLIDGLRYDLYNASMPHLEEFGRQGVKVRMMTPSFPTKSLPVMHTIATGLYTESHGVVSSNFDVDTGEIEMVLDTMNSSSWYDTGAEPIWVSAKLKGLATGTYMYPGGSVEIKGIRPDKNFAQTKWRRDNLSFRDRIDGIIAWLREDDLDVVILYYGQLDATLHFNVMGSAAVANKIHEVDDGIGYLMEGLEQQGLRDNTNVIITGDHGFVEAEGTVARIWDYISEDDVEFYFPHNMPVASLKPKEGKKEMVYNALKDVHVDLLVYKKEDTPERFHFKNNDRILDILLVANPPLIIGMNVDDDRYRRGVHGYDNKILEMKAAFYASGPAFKSGYTIDNLEAVDIYPLMCELIGIQPAPNNGSVNKVKDLLIHTISGQTRIIGSYLSVIVVIGLALMSGIEH